MIPVQFEYTAAHSVEEAVQYLRAHPSARVLAGGTDLLPALVRQRLTPTAVVDLQQIPGLTAITALDGGRVRIGALTPLVDIAEHPGIGESYPGLAEAIAATADPLIRNRATLGGNLAQSSANGDAAAALLAIGATITISGPGGDRAEPIDALFAAPRGFQLAAAEIITFVDLPANAAGSAYEKFRNPASTYALCGVAALVRLAADGTISECGLAVTGATRTVTRLPVLEADLVGRPATSAALSSTALQTQAERLVFIDDWVASADYRAHLMQVLATRALQRAAARAGQKGAR